MYATRLSAARFARPAFVIALLAGIATLTGPTATIALSADSDLVRVEEDWELIVKEPDLETVSPQVTCIISPHGHVNGLFAAFNINHKTHPAWEPGGLQLQLWNGDVSVAGYNFPRHDLLNTVDERITWTQSVEVQGGQLKFEVVNGDSNTWGKFGGQGYLRATIDSPVENLNSYSSAVSVANSGISYAANRVTSLKLLKVRGYNQQGDVFQDNTVKVVFPHQ
jgi:hypothetical protein